MPAPRRPRSKEPRSRRIAANRDRHVAEPAPDSDRSHERRSNHVAISDRTSGRLIPYIFMSYVLYKLWSLAAGGKQVLLGVWEAGRVFARAPASRRAPGEGPAR